MLSGPLLSGNDLALLAGLRTSLALFGIALTAAFLVGFPLGIMASRFPSSLGRIIAFFGMIAVATPPIVVLLWVHYPGQSILGIIAPPFASAAFAIGALGAGFVSQAVTATVRDFPKGLEEAALLCGLSKLDTLRSIKAPLLVRRFAPQAMFIALSLFQTTLLASLIGVEEVFRVALRINSLEYRPIPIFTSVAVLCLVFAIPLQLVGTTLAKRLPADLAGPKS